MKIWPGRYDIVEVCRLGANGEIIGMDGSLSGEDVLPGFALPLAKLFA